MFEFWLVSGVLGWVAMMLYRVITDGLPKKGEVDASSYVMGIIFALLLGPLCFLFLAACIRMDWMDNDQADK